MSKQVEEQKVAETKVIGRTYSSTTKSILGEDGFWTVTSEMTEGRQLEGSDDWEWRTLTSMSIDKDLVRAQETAMTSVVTTFQEDYAEKGFMSMFDAEDYQIEEKENGEERSA